MTSVLQFSIKEININNEFLTAFIKMQIEIKKIYSMRSYDQKC